MNLGEVGVAEASLVCVFTGREQRRPIGSVVMVTARLPEDSLYTELLDQAAGFGLRSVERIGDCNAAGTIAAAVFSGRRYAEALDRPPLDGIGFHKEQVVVLPGTATEYSGRARLSR
jgi:dimethylamine/trimethylamine dehydrogenase